MEEGQVKPREILPLRIFLEGPVSDKMSVEFMALIYKRLHLHREIEIYVDSPGGSVPASMTIVELIRTVSATHAVSTIGISLVASCALDIFMAGDNRHAYKTCKFMQHHPHVSVCNANTLDLEHINGELSKDMEYGLLNNTRDSLLTPMQLLGHIMESRNNEFFFDYAFAQEYMLVNRDGIPPITKGKNFTILGDDDEG